MRFKNIALFLLVACEPPEPHRVGEFPTGLVAFGNVGVLLTRFVEISEDRSDPDFRFFRVRSDGSVDPFFSLRVPPPYLTNILFATVTTVSVDGPTGFLLTQFGGENVHAIRVTDAASSVQDLNIPTVGGSVQISVLNRDRHRQWVWISHSNWSTQDFSFPLLEFEGNNITVLAANVLWAHCGVQWCQQLRTEGAALRLYAAPITSDAYLRPVTETPRQGNFTSGILRTCSLDPKIAVVQFDNVYYFLSNTEPTLSEVSTSLVIKAFPKLLSDCPAFAKDNEEPQPIYRGVYPLSQEAAKFADGTRLTAKAVKTGTLGLANCSWSGQLQNDCESDDEIYGTSLRFENGMQSNQFFLHPPSSEMPR